MEIADEIDYEHDGEEGLQYLNKHCAQGTGPDLIFPPGGPVDNKMPRMDGAVHRRDGRPLPLSL